MKDISARDVSMVAGIAAATAGVGVQFGYGWALIVAGALLIGLTVASLVFN